MAKLLKVTRVQTRQKDRQHSTRIFFQTEGETLFERAKHPIDARNRAAYLKAAVDAMEALGLIKNRNHPLMRWRADLDPAFGPGYTVADQNKWDCDILVIVKETQTVPEDVEVG